MCVVVRKGSAVLELLSSEDESLLIWWDTFFVLDLSFDVLNSVCWLEGDGSTSGGTGRSDCWQCKPQLLPLLISLSSSSYSTFASEYKKETLFSRSINVSPFKM
jgi:hypothetical protein